MNRGKNKDKQKLYKLLVNLPFSESEESYNKVYTTLINENGQVVTKELKQYLKSRHLIRFKWVKCFMKKTFTCGNCTSSRIESKHRVYKTLLNGNSRLSEIFSVFKKLEDQNIERYQDELAKLKKKESSELDKHDLIVQMKEKYSSYAVKKTKEILLESIHYAVERKGEKW